MRWRRARLSEVADIERDGIAPDAIATGTRYLGLEHIESGGNILGAAKVEAGDLASTKFRFTSSHVLYGKLRPYLAKIATPDFDGICSTDIVPIMPRPGLDRSFLTHFLRQPSMIEFANSRTTGANLPRLSPKALADFEIPLPPLEEQKRIAAILDQADELRRKRQRALDRLNQLGQAIFIEMFVQRTSNWPERLLAEVVTPGTIVTYGIVQAGEEYPGGVPYIRTGDIKDGEIKLNGLRHTDPATAAKFQRSRVRSGEIVMSIRATVGTVAFVPNELDGANLTQGTARISPGPDVSPWYLIEYLRSDAVQGWIEKQVKGATFREITLSRLRELSVVIPPQDLQNRFSEMMLRIFAQRTLATQALSV